MAEQSKKKPRLSDNTESSPSKKTSILEVSSPVATMAPAPARASPSPVATRTPSLAAPSPLSKRAPSLAAPSPAAKSKPIAVVKLAAATVAVTNPVPATAPASVATSPIHASPLVAVTDPVPAMAPALVATSPVATSTPASAVPSPAATTEPTVLPAPNTVVTPTPAMAAPSPVATAKPTTTVKDESEDGGVLGSDEQAAVVPAAAEEAVILEVKKKWLQCVTCHAPLKPRIFMCDGGHAACCDCGGGGGEKKHCGACNRAATYTHIPCMDGLVGAYKVPCPYKDFGCARSTAYHAAADHKARCAHAPCYCLECPFEGSPPSLLLHLTDQSGRHRWPVETIKYQIRHSFVVPASEHRRLLVAEEDGRVFLLAVGAGRGASGVRPVNIVCVRGNAGGADARPLYTGVLWVDCPLAAAGHLRGGFQQKGDVASCGLPGEVDMEHGQLHAHVNPEMLHGESKEVHLGICITKFW